MLQSFKANSGHAHDLSHGELPYRTLPIGLRVFSYVARLSVGAFFSAVLAAATADVSKLPPPVARPVDFARDVRPIFEKNCVSCHGPKKQRSGYRLDARQVALTGGEGSAPNIIAGKSAASPLIHYVAGLDEDMRMPSEGEPLTAEEVGILRAWIDQGAAWPDDGRPSSADAWKSHWSFRPLVRPAVPTLSDGASHGAIDAFVAAKLAEHGLGASAPADARTLIRRLYFDLTGLPPTPAEVDAFEADNLPDAYSQLVERLLASPGYGERWARHWLDVVKFAESDGFERNNLRPNAWPYRDYVIRAFNEDKPYDLFVREQLAGDALGVDEATGFLVGGSFDFLQSFEPPYFNLGQRADELSEIVGTTSSAFMGLTVGCARCHDHKFDPISQQDHYSLVAVFQGMEHGQRPQRPANHAQLEAQAAAPLRRIAEIDVALALFASNPQLRHSLVVTPLEASESAAVAYTPGAARGQAEDAGDELRLPTLNANFRVRREIPGNAKDWIAWSEMPAGRFRIWLSWAVAREHSNAVTCRLDGHEIARVNQSVFADGIAAVAGEKRWSGFFDAGIHTFTAVSRLALSSDSRASLISADAVLLEEIRSQEDERPTHAPHLRAPVVVKTNIESFAPTPAKFVRFTVLASNTPEGYLDELEVFTSGPQSRNVALKEFGAKATSPVVGGEDGNPFYVNDGRYNERAAWNSPAKEPGYVQIEFPRVEQVDRILWSRNRSDRQPKLDDHLVTDYRIELSVDGRTWIHVASAADRLAQPWRKRVPLVSTLSSVPSARVAEIARLTEERRALRSQVAQLLTFPEVYAGKLREPAPTFRLHRGDPLSPRDQVAPGALTRFGPKLELPRDLPEQQRRIALGRWLTSTENPLPARVMVNRLWHYHFGTGLVDTPSDFGMNGARPTHPELLDWLAAEFIERGWSSVQTFVPKREFTPDDLRRMVYQLKPRAQLDDVFGAFDCPDAGQIAPSRTRSTTPLQAFNLLNSPFALQQAGRLAERLAIEAGKDPASQVESAFQLLLGRRPALEEQAAATALIAEHGLPLFCRALFNSNEFIYVP